MLPGDARSFAFRAPCAVAGGSVRVRVTALDQRGGQWDSTSTERVIVPARQCLAGESPAGGLAFAFLPVAPNPAVGGAVLRYRLPAPPAPPAGGAAAATAAPGGGRVTFYDARGRRVRAFAVGGTPGVLAEAVWDGRDAAGRAVRPGIYFARFTAGGESAVQRFVLLSPAGGR
jgi:hypothetical protein